MTQEEYIKQNMELVRKQGDLKCSHRRAMAELAEEERKEIRSIRLRYEEKREVMREAYMREQNDLEFEKQRLAASMKLEA